MTPPGLCNHLHAHDCPHCEAENKLIAAVKLAIEYFGLNGAAINSVDVGIELESALTALSESRRILPDNSGINKARGLIRSALALPRRFFHHVRSFLIRRHLSPLDTPRW